MPFGETAKPIGAALVPAAFFNVLLIAANILGFAYILDKAGFNLGLLPKTRNDWLDVLIFFIVLMPGMAMWCKQDSEIEHKSRFLEKELRHACVITSFSWKDLFEYIEVEKLSLSGRHREVRFEAIVEAMEKQYSDLLIASTKTVKERSKNKKNES